MSKDVYYDADYLRAIVTDGLRRMPVLNDAELLSDERDEAIIEMAGQESDIEYEKAQSPLDAFLSPRLKPVPLTELTKAQSFDPLPSPDKAVSDRIVKVDKFQAGIEASEDSEQPRNMHRRVSENSKPSTPIPEKTKVQDKPIPVRMDRVRTETNHDRVKSVNVETLSETTVEALKPQNIDVAEGDDHLSSRSKAPEYKTVTQPKLLHIKPSDASKLRGLTPSLGEQLLENTRRAKQRNMTQGTQSRLRRNVKHSQGNEIKSQVKIGRVDITVAARKVPQTVKPPKAKPYAPDEERRASELSKYAALNYRRRF